MPLVARCGSSFLRTVTFLIIQRCLPLKVPLLYICFSKSTAYNTFQFKKMFWIWWKVLDTIILHAAFEVGLSLDQGQGVYSGWSDLVVSSQLRLCHTCIIDVMWHPRPNIHTAQNGPLVNKGRQRPNELPKSSSHKTSSMNYYLHYIYRPTTLQINGNLGPYDNASKDPII